MYYKPSIFDYHGNLNEYNRDMNAYEFYKKMEEQQNKEFADDVIGIIDEISKARKQLKQIRIARGKMVNDIVPISQMIVENTDEEIILDKSKFDLVHTLFEKYYQDKVIPEIVEYAESIKPRYEKSCEYFAHCYETNSEDIHTSYKKAQMIELEFIKGLVFYYTDPTQKFYRGLVKFIKIGSMVLIFGILLCFILTTILFK